MNFEPTIPAITAADVKAKARMRFLPTLFGSAYLRGESAVYSLAQYYSEDYQGGSWRFAELSCGGGFMYPDGDRIYQVDVQGNGFSGRMNAEVFGMFITSMALNRLSWQAYEASQEAKAKNRQAMYDSQESLCDKLIRHQEFLKAYADQHPDSHQFYRAID